MFTASTFNIEVNFEVNFAPLTNIPNSSWSNRFLSHCTNDSKVLVSKDCVSETSCLSEGWTLLGEDCHKNFVSKSMSDVFMLSVILFIGTFALAIFLKNFRTQRFFPSRVCVCMCFRMFVCVCVCFYVFVCFLCVCMYLYAFLSVFKCF